MERMALYKSRKKATVVTIVGFAVGIAGALFLLYADEIVVGWSFVIAAAFTIIYGIGALADRKPHIILTPQGITDPHDFREEIAWETIAFADAIFFRGQYVVRLLLRKNDKPDRRDAIGFRGFDALYAPGVKAVYLHTDGLDIHSLQLAALIRRMTAVDASGRSDLLHDLVAKPR